MTDLLIDGPSLFNRAWFAAWKPEAVPTDVLQAALMSFTTILNFNVDRLGQRIDRTLFGWDDRDVPDKGRDPRPSEFYSICDIFKDSTAILFGSLHVSHPKTEADDIVATAVEQSEADHVYVVSGDKDLMQLHGGKVRYYCLNTKAVLSTPFITSKWGIKHPNQLPIALAIIGDAVDKIKGIPKWGKVKTRALFKQVTETMDFEQALDVIDSQLPNEHKDIFYDCLNRTLLDRQIPEVPRASPLIFASVKEVESIGLPAFTRAYEKLCAAYQLNQPAESLAG